MRIKLIIAVGHNEIAKTETILKVFVASPGDVVEERQILKDVIDEFNVTWSATHNVRLDLIKWETHSRPGFGEDAQDVISQQIGDEYDIFLGIMWGRFGSATKRGESGTEQEFDRAYSRLTSSPENVRIMFYFKDAGIPPSQTDVTQLAKVQAFKKEIASEYGGLYHEFETTEEFRTKSRMHLSGYVQDWLKSSIPTPETRRTTNTTAASATEAVHPLAHLAALTDDDYDDGIVELSDRVIDAMAAVGSVFEKMSEASDDLRKKTEQRTSEINQLTSGATTLDMKAAKRISNNAANDLEVYVQRMSVEIPEFHRQHSLAMDTLGKLVMISESDLNEDPRDIRAALAQMEEYRNEITTLSEALAEFRAAVTGLPRMTTTFNRARRRATAIVDDLLVQLRTAGNQVKDVEQLLQRMVGAEKNAQ